MSRLTRRRLLLGGAAIAAGGLAVGGFALRLHKTPRREPYLTEAHLAALANADLPRPRVLFIGNSMVLGNDLPGLVAERAAEDGVELSVATAAAGGARLVETVRLPGLGPLLAREWDAVVAQDFTKTPLRAPDRWGSRRAMGPYRPAGRTCARDPVSALACAAGEPRLSRRRHSYDTAGTTSATMPTAPWRITKALAYRWFRCPMPGWTSQRPAATSMHRTGITRTCKAPASWPK